MEKIINDLYFEQEKVNEAIKDLCSKNPNDTNISFLEGCLSTLEWMIEKVENHKCNCVVKNEKINSEIVQNEKLVSHSIEICKSDKFDWNKIFKHKTVVHCNNEEKAIELLKEAHERGLKWCTDESYLEDTQRNKYKENTCYYLLKGEFCSLEFYKEENYIILSYEEALLINTDNKEYQKIEPCKIEVSSKTSEIIQEICFDKGIYWPDAGCSSENYLYIYYVNGEKIKSKKYIDNVKSDSLPEIKDIDFIEKYGNLDKQELRDLKLELKYKNDGEENADK